MPETLLADQPTGIAGETSAITMLAALAALSNTPFPTAAARINAYLDLVARLIGVRSAFVSQLTSSVMMVIESYDNHGCGIPSNGVVALEETFCQHVRATGEAVIVTDAATDVRVIDVATRRDFSIGAYLGVPLLLSDGTPFGTLCALDPEPCWFSQSHVDLARIVASQIATVIEREGLHCTLTQTSDTAQQQLQIAQTTLDQQAEMLRIVAHDVRTPLTTITGYTSLLKSGLFGAVTDSQANVLEQIGGAARFINRLANDLVDTAATETQQLALIVETFDPHRLAEQVTASCAIDARNKGLALCCVSNTVPATIDGDPDRLQQVLLNLVSNALRYTQIGSVTLTLSSAADTIEFRVADTGPGIAPEIQDQIWERYKRASDHGPGLGLGLYVVRQLVTAMGGKVGVESTPGYGSSFWVRLPLQGPRPQTFQWT